ncbi:uncharacterized protein KGF55_003532 [Candida pseudojiufengensis]|uniref:uncharacterized protein n=1 Tax=Candida pseudojiufengensis TaxID=497109 RepID=UPI002223F47D|nr:uncharacterized protein KGF55_003532 [Candida pseudojiufengensis]KAI5962456.1 hypothetical protein KGF55_003532 [Candida pseudojiufengensis]
MNTRPDISFTVNALGVKSSNPTFKSSNPTFEDYDMMIYCILYLKKNRDICIKYESNTLPRMREKFIVYGMSDASFGPPGDRKSITGYSIYVNGNLCSWGTKKQRYLTNSSMIAEIVALGETTNRAMKLRDTILALDFTSTKVTIFEEDNELVIKYTYNHKISSSRRSIDICMKIIRDIC